jgi:hypothetical protein
MLRRRRDECMRGRAYAFLLRALRNLSSQAIKKSCYLTGISTVVWNETREDGATHIESLLAAADGRVPELPQGVRAELAAMHAAFVAGRRDEGERLGALTAASARATRRQQQQDPPHNRRSLEQKRHRRVIAEAAQTLQRRRLRARSARRTYNICSGSMWNVRTHLAVSPSSCRTAATCR